MGITHPSIKGQERVVRAAYKRANLDPDKTAYLECHGTGTPVGDPIEVNAVSNAMNDTRSKDKPLFVGAVSHSLWELGGRMVTLSLHTDQSKHWPQRSRQWHICRHEGGNDD